MDPDPKGPKTYRTDLRIRIRIRKTLESRDPDPGSSQNPIIGPDLSTTVPLLDLDPDPMFFTKN